MSYWSHNPELFTKIVFNEMVSKGLASEDEDRWRTNSARGS